MTHLLDSVILIDHFNGVSEATQVLLRGGGSLAVSVITRAEVLTGFSAAEEPRAVRLLDRFPTLGIDAAIADLAARLRCETRWKMPDAFQAAVALHRGLRLLTRNTRDFPPERFDFVEVPYRL